uniref:SGNH_hydro domain-containing protein n=1 Tax=Panagrellus redivivus TaxID=6233 RepID=A0A7E4UW39_PANRE
MACAPRHARASTGNCSARKRRERNSQSTFEMFEKGVKLTELFDGEEDFVLPAPRLPPPPSAPFELEGWADVQPAPRPTSPVKKPAGCMSLRQKLRQKIQGLREARQKAPTSIGRFAQKVSAVKQRLFDAIRGGFQRAVGGMFGKRKRVADVASEAVDIPIQAKRGRFDGDNEAPADLPAYQEGHREAEEVIDEVFDVPVPDFDGFDDFEYGRAEDQAATEAILEVGLDPEDRAVIEDVPMEEVREDPAPIAAAPVEVNGECILANNASCYAI